MTTTTATAPTAYRLGGGTSRHLASITTYAEGHAATHILCNSWGSTNGSYIPARPIVGTAGADATCKRCLKIAAGARA